MMDNSRMSIPQGQQIDRNGRSLTSTTSVSSRKPSPEATPRPRQANFARPFDENNYPEQRRTPLVDRHTPKSDVFDNRSSAPSTRLQPDQQSAFFPANTLTLERLHRPSQLKLASRLPSVDENAGSALSRQRAPQEVVSNSSWSETPISGVQSASINQTGWPVFKKARRNDNSRSNQPIRESETLPATDREKTIKALSAAIAGGFVGQSPTTPTWPNATQEGYMSTIHMPFADSPTSIYTQASLRSTPTFDEAHDGISLKANTPTLAEEQNRNHETLGPQLSSPFAQRSFSVNSTNQLLGLGIDQHIPNGSVGHEPRVPSMAASGEVDTRQSITSLPELIRRATKLASNLDRGRTASRLGLEDVLGYGNKQARGTNRRSTYSDVLASFPAPVSSSPLPLRQQETWDENEKRTTQSRSRRRRNVEQPERRYCGLSLTGLLVVMVVFVILFAAALLLPIFLNIVPNEKKSSTNLSRCPASFPCQNGGISVVDNNACSCVCVDGFTGNQCGTAADPDCVTADLRQDGATYENATVGSSVLSVLSQSQSLFNIPLNASALLSVFAANNISCSGENSLVSFNNARTSKQGVRGKRFIIIPGLEQEVPPLPVPSRTYNIAPPEGTAGLMARDSGTASSSTDDTPQTASSSVSPSGSAIYSTTASSSSPSPTSTTVTSQQLVFAEVVVLFILAQSRAPSVAVNAQQLMERYFLQGGPSSGNATVKVGFGAGNGMTANFAQFSILLGNGTTIGGASGT